MGSLEGIDSGLRNTGAVTAVTNMEESVQLFESLPEDVLARIFGLLSPSQLAWVERVNRRCRGIVVRHKLWRQHCLRAHPAMADATGSQAPDTSQVPCRHLHASRPLPNSSQASGSAAASLDSGGSLSVLAPNTESLQRSAFYKKLHYRLTAPMARESLIAEALVASSTDHPQESIANVLNPVSRSRDIATCYWSSRGNPDPNSRDALTFRLAHPLCIVSEVQLRPFKAFFQWGSPIYAPKAVRFRLGGLACFDYQGRALPPIALRQAARSDVQAQQHTHQQPPQQQAGAAPDFAAGAASPSGARGDKAAGSSGAQAQRQWVWESAEFEVEQTDVLQRFPIPPTLCVGGYLRVELLGKRQLQAADEQYYACICYLRALGFPIYYFQLRQLPHPWGGMQLSGRVTLPSADKDQQQQQEWQEDEQPASWQLTYNPSDPLVEAGGLAAVSEGGRLAALAAAGGGAEEWQAEEEFDEDAEDGFDMIWGDSDLEDLEGSLDGHSDDQGPGDWEMGAAGGDQEAPPPLEAADGDDSGGSGSDGSPSSSSDGSGSSGLAGGGMGASEDEWMPGGHAGAY